MYKYKINRNKKTKRQFSSFRNYFCWSIYANASIDETGKQSLQILLTRGPLHTRLTLNLALTWAAYRLLGQLTAYRGE